MLKLKLQYFGHLMRKPDSLEKTLMPGKTEGKRRRGRQRMRWLDGVTYSMDMSLSKLLGDGEGQGSLVCCSPWGHSRTWLGDWTTTMVLLVGSSYHNEVLKQKLILWQFSKFKIKVLAVWFLLRLLSLAYRQPSSLCLYLNLPSVCICLHFLFLWGPQS